jgi:hemerythrin superfamily protein
MRDIYGMLAADHREVEKLFDDCERCRGPELQQTYAQLANTILVHAKAEERAFYARLTSLGAPMDDAREEHDDVERLIDECRSAVGDEEIFFGKLGALRAAVEQHVEREEGELFAKARELLDEDAARDARDVFAKLKDAIKASVTMGETPVDVSP